MKKTALLVMIALCATALAGVTFAGDGKARAKGEPRSVELEGKVLCAKCSLQQEGGCQNVLVVTKKGKEKHYYLVKNDVYQEFGDVCMATRPVRITGTVTRDEGRAWLTPASIVPAEGGQG